jgi:GNAT superfamily N-acetyltransferase
MSFSFKIMSKNELELVIPLVYELNEGKIDKVVLRSRFNKMKTQNYECAGLFRGNELIGITGLWFCTRHYAGKSVELDHVYIKPEYRGEGLGKKFMKWINDYAIDKGCKALELNTYVQNYPSHKFYYNDGYEILGYHFLKSL